MKDLNFFDSYIEKQKFSIDKQKAFYSIAIFIVLFIAFFSTYNQVKIRRISKEIVKLKAVVEDENIKKKIVKITEKEKELDKLRSSVNDLRLFDKFIESNSTINDYLLDAITSNIPKDIFLTSISMYTDRIQIVGSAKDQLIAAQLVKNLETVETFKHIFVSSISKEEEHYNFVLNIYLKDVNIDGEDTNLEETEIQKSID